MWIMSGFLGSGALGARPRLGEALGFLMVVSICLRSLATFLGFGGNALRHAGAGLGGCGFLAGFPPGERERVQGCIQHLGAKAFGGNRGFEPGGVAFRISANQPEVARSLQELLCDGGLDPFSFQPNHLDSKADRLAVWGCCSLNKPVFGFQVDRQPSGSRLGWPALLFDHLGELFKLGGGGGWSGCELFEALQRVAEPFGFPDRGSIAAVE